MNTDLRHIEFGSSPQDTLTALIQLLSPHVPHSLCVLGSILNTCPRSETVANVDPSQVSVWSTTPLPTTTTTTITNTTESSHVAPSRRRRPREPALFSILVFSPTSHQFRFFCSADASPGPPTEDEEAHVLHIFRSVLHMAAQHSPTYTSILTRNAHASSHTHPTDRVQTDPPMIVIGGVHERWHACLRPFSVWQSPCTRFVLPPTVTSTSTFTLLNDGRTAQDGAKLSQGWVISQIRESDISLVRESTSIPRSVDYIRSRAAYSVCIRSKGTRDGNGQKPCAWALMHADGSIGTLFVDPSQRGKGLAKLVINTLVQKLALREGDDSTSVYGDLGGGALGWNWTDTDVDNEKARKLFHSLEGWREELLSHWTYMVIP